MSGSFYFWFPVLFDLVFKGVLLYFFWVLLEQFIGIRDILTQIRNLLRK